MEGNMSEPKSLIYSLRLRWERRRLARSENRLRSLDRAIRDHVFNLDRWSFADRPSEYDDRKAAIHALIRKYEKAGGDVLDVLPYGFDYLAAEALPASFQRTQTIRNGWKTSRV